MKKILSIILFLSFAFSSKAQMCDTLDGGILELQFTTSFDGIIYGNGYCIKQGIVNGGLEMVGGTLSVIDGDTVGQVLRWTGTDWEPRLIIFPDAVSGDTSYNGITYVVGSPNAHKLGGTLTENTTISGVNTRTLTLNNLHTLSIEAERTGGSGKTTADFGSTNVSGASIFHTLTADPNQLANMNVNATSGNLFRLQNAANVLTQTQQYWDGASHVTDITSTDGVEQRTFRVTKNGVFITDLAKTGAFSEPGVMMYDTLTGELRYQSPDILFAPLAPSQPNRQIVFGTGTGISSDTSLQYSTAKTLVMNRDSASAEPVIKIDYNDATIGKPMFLFAPRRQNNYTYPVKFGLYSNNFPSANPGKPGNHTWRLAYNLGRPVTALSSLEASFETHYWQYMLNGARKRSGEFHIEQNDTTGGTHRLITARFAHDGSTGDVGLVSDGFYLAKYYNQDPYLTYSRFNKYWYWNDTVMQIWNKPQVGYPFAFFRSADGSRLWRIFQADANNRLVINPEGNELYTYAQNFIFHTAAGLRTSDGNPVSIGNSTYPTGFIVYAPDPYAIRFRNATANSGLDIWSFKNQYFGGTGYFAIETPSSNDAITIRGNTQNALLNLRSSSVGINVFDPAAATLHVDGTVRLQGLPGRTTETRMIYANGNNDLRVGEISDFTGSGTANYIPKWLTSTKLTNSQLYDDGTNVGIGTTSPAQKLHIEGTARITGSDTDDPVGLVARDADGDIRGISLDGLQITGGTLSQAYDNNEYGNGTHTWNPSYIHVYANADVGNVTLNLSSPFSEGRDYFCAAVNNGTNTVTLSGTLYVDGVGSASTYTLGAWEQVTVRYRDAWSAWFINK